MKIRLDTAMLCVTACLGGGCFFTFAAAAAVVLKLWFKVERKNGSLSLSA